jgi:hypothetical protein
VLAPMPLDGELPTQLVEEAAVLDVRAAVLHRLLSQARYEVLPTARVEATIVEHLAMTGGTREAAA